MSLFGSWGRSPRKSLSASAGSTLRTPAGRTSESDWQRLRDQPRPQDLVLSALARTWCCAFPERHRPEQLCSLFPRLANRLALCWDDPSLASRVLDELVVDRRRTRTGFPPAVSQELIRLHLLRPSRAPPSNFSPLWDASGMASCDR